MAYDPFWNTADESKSTQAPLWTHCISRFGIPYVSTGSDIAFWDERQARYCDDSTILHQLSKGLFLDGDAARWLCKRGYGKYIGVNVEDDIACAPLCYDLGAREVICPQFRSPGCGQNMPIAHMFSPGGNGKLLRLSVTDVHCEVISEAYTFQRKYIAPAMTRFINELGGHVVVMGMTLDGNNSQALFNYRRMRLLKELMLWCTDEYVFVKEAPDVFIIMNEAESIAGSSCFDMLTLIDLCEDGQMELKLHLPPKWRESSLFYLLDENGEPKPLNYTLDGSELTVYNELHYLSPMFILRESTPIAFL